MALVCVYVKRAELVLVPSGFDRFAAFRSLQLAVLCSISAPHLFQLASQPIGTTLSFRVLLIKPGVRSTNDLLDEKKSGPKTS